MSMLCVLVKMITIMGDRLRISGDSVLGEWAVNVHCCLVWFQRAACGERGG